MAKEETNTKPTAEEQTVKVEKKPQVNHANLRKYVKMHIPQARPGEEQSIYVGVNGFGTLVPRGKTVSLPKYVADNLAHVLRAEEKYERDVAKSHQQPDDHINRTY